MQLTFGKWRLSSDNYNVVVEKLRVPREQMRTKKDAHEPTWAQVGFYGTLEAAVSGLIELGIKESGADSLAGLLSDIEKIEEDITRALKAAT